MTKGRTASIITADSPEGRLLMDIAREAGLGHGLRPRKSIARDRLQRAGLIFSRPHPGWARAVGGKGRNWRPTDSGKILATALQNVAAFSTKGLNSK